MESVTIDDHSLLVRPDVATQQLELEHGAQASAISGNRGESTAKESSTGTSTVDTEISQTNIDKPVVPIFRRYHGSVSLDPTRVGSDAGRIAEEVIAHLVGLIGASVEVTLEIEAKIPDGVPDNVVRIVIENSRTLKFRSHGFEVE